MTQRHYRHLRKRPVVLALASTEANAEAQDVAAGNPEENGPFARALIAGCVARRRAWGVITAQGPTTPQPPGRLDQKPQFFTLAGHGRVTTCSSWPSR
ncbi:MAG: hypothetical protein R3F43_23075 [bacterium]